MAFNCNPNTIRMEAEALNESYWCFKLALLNLPTLNPNFYSDTQVAELLDFIKAVNKDTLRHFRQKRLQELRRLPVRHAERALWYKKGDGRKAEHRHGSVAKYTLSLSAKPRKRHFTYI